MLRSALLAAGFAALASAAQALPVTFSGTYIPQETSGSFASVDRIEVSVTIDDDFLSGTFSNPFIIFSGPDYGASIAGFSGSSTVFTGSGAESALALVQDAQVLPGTLPSGIPEAEYDIVQVGPAPTGAASGSVELAWAFVAVAPPGWLPDDVSDFSFNDPLPPGGWSFLLVQQILYGDGPIPEILGSASVILGQGPSAVPLPGAGALAGLGLGALGLLRRRATRRRPAP